MVKGAGVEGLRYDGVDLSQLERLARSNDTLFDSAYAPDAPEHEMHFMNLKPSDVIITKQVRVTYEDEPLDDMANSLATNGQASPTNVAWLRSDETCRKYIESINEKKGTDYELGKFPFISNPDGTYYVVFAGHQRTLGNVIKNLRRSGDDENVDAHTMPCLVYADISYDDAYTLQITENACRQNPPIWEEASAWVIRYRELKAAGRVSSMTEFAKNIGVSDDRLRNAIRFTELPPVIQAFVIGDHAVFDNYPGKYQPLEYRTAVELWKLKAFLPDNDVVAVAFTAMNEEWGYRQTVREIAKYEATHKLPERVQRFMAEAGISIDVSPYVHKLVGLYPEDAIIAFVYDYDTNRWSMEKLRSEVSIMVSRAQNQQFSLLYEDTAAQSNLIRQGRLGSETRRFVSLTREMHRVAQLWDGDHLPGMSHVALSDKTVVETLEKFLDALEKIAAKKNGESPPGLRDRLFGVHALLAASRTGSTIEVVNEIIGLEPTFDPIEREFTPPLPPPKPLF